MSVKLNNKEYTGLMGYLLALPIIVITFSWLAVIFLGTVLLILSPIIAAIALIVWLT